MGGVIEVGAMAVSFPDRSFDVTGAMFVMTVVPDPARLSGLAVAADRRDWWAARTRECYRLLAAQSSYRQTTST